MRFKASEGRYQFSSIRTKDRILSVLKNVLGETRRNEQWLSLAGGSLPYWMGNGTQSLMGITSYYKPAGFTTEKVPQ